MLLQIAKNAILIGLTLYPAVAFSDQSGERVYKTKCFVCHLTGAAGAPRLDDRAAWVGRIEKGEKALLRSVRAGLGAMPPRGTCPQCSDSELEKAIRYMLERVD